MATGTAIGILVPTLHKNRKRDTTQDPLSSGSDPGCQRVGFVFTF
jgi:hypothetical protein